jgi:hypothetical protein
MPFLWPADICGDEKSQRPRPKITVAKETTYFLGPLDKEGYVDYVAALNEHFSRGVTPENNANVLFWRASGPVSESATVPSGLFKLMGIKPPTKDGLTYIDLGKYVTDYAKIPDGDPRAGAIFEQQSGASQRPWVEAVYPHLAIWLKLNEAPLSVVVEATKRPQSYAPIFCPRDGEMPQPLHALVLYGTSTRREYGRALTARGMLHLGEGRTAAAWEDLLACHRLARHVGRSPWLLDGLVCVSIDGASSASDVAFVAHAELSAAQAVKCLRDWQALGPLPSMADRVDVTERAAFLDTMQLIARFGGEDIVTPIISDEAPPLWLRALDVTLVDWDAAFKMGNGWYDRVVAAMRVKDRKKMAKAFEDIDAKLRELTAESNSETFPDKKLLAHDAVARKTAGERVAGLTIRLLSSAWIAVRTAEDRAKQYRSNLDVALALAAHRAEKDRYPEKLSELSPKYLKTVPDDLFSGKPLIYRATDTGFLLYSVGANGKDDGGRRYNDTPAGDDLVVRMPPEE